jgi:hypothetical protein
MTPPQGEPAPPPGDDSADHVTDLMRWERSGAIWRVLDRSPSALTIGLFSCDGGEQMGQVSSRDPALLGYVGDRTSSDDDV